MKEDVYRNGDGGAHEEDSEDEESALEEELSFNDPTAPARALAALNALRKSRQHYDVLLVAGGTEVAAHRAVLAAVSPFFLEALAYAPPGTHPTFGVDDVDADALRELVEYAYTGRLRVTDSARARLLYYAAWKLRVDGVRSHMAERLLKRLTPADCLDFRSLPDLDPKHVTQLDTFIANNFDEVCSSGALGALPQIRVEMLRESSATNGDEPAAAVASAALVWLQATDLALEELCSRTHLLYVNSGGELCDCGDLPANCGDAPELQEYRREAAERKGRTRKEAVKVKPKRPGCTVLASRGAEKSTRALLSIRGRLTSAHIVWRDNFSTIARGGPLEDTGPRRAPLTTGRCALGAVSMNNKLLVCGGYDRARVLRSAEIYDPTTNTWAVLPDMRSARARFPAVKIGESVYIMGGSDGHNELDTVDVFEGGKWRAKSKLPLALSHAAAAVDEESGVLYVIGGWTGGLSLKRVMQYSPIENQWTEGPPLNTGRSQCAGVLFGGALWALGGCDAWHCLSSAERLGLGGGGPTEGAWQAGPPLPTARRSMGAAAWRGALFIAGGSDGAASLQRTDYLSQNSWQAGPRLRKARSGLALCPVDDVLYAVGGYDGKEFLSCVECLYEVGGEWTTLCVPRAICRAPLDHDHKVNGTDSHNDQ